MSLPILTARQNNFLLNLLVGMPQQDAYEQAGYDARGPVAASNASTLIRHPKFSKCYKRALADIKAKITKPYEVTRDRILNEYAKLAFLDPRQFYDEQGNIKPIHKLDADVAAAIKGVDVQVRRIPGDENGEFDEIHTKKITMADKKAALDSLSRILGMFDDKVKVGIDPDSLDKVFDKLPEEFAVAVKAVIAKNAQAQIGEK